MPNKTTSFHDTKKRAEISHPGMMGDGTEEQDLGESGNPAARMKRQRVTICGTVPRRVAAARATQVLRKLSRPLRVSVDIEAQTLRSRRVGHRRLKVHKRQQHTMTEYSYSQTTAGDCAEAGPLATDKTTPPPRPAPMPTQVIELWTARLLFVALLRRVVLGLRRAMSSRSAAFSAANSNEPR
jgi:hypothetical protein